VKEVEGGIRYCAEKEEEEEQAAVGASMGEDSQAANSLQGPPSLRKKAWDVGPSGIKLELHPLLTRWALWFSKNDRTRAWRDNLHLVTKFDTVEDFWAIYSHVKLASKLSSGCDYALFKDGIEPMWEDSKNKWGGRWLVSLAKQQRHIELDGLWLETLLCLIGESFEEYSRDVCGAVINIRTKGDKIAVWTREAENQTSVLYIGRVYKDRLGLSTKTIIGYQAHADTATKSNSLAKNKFV
ncbi:Eukaryotic translation initiation factor 4E type 1B, partial [Galemys pyrenaicus]